MKIYKFNFAVLLVIGVTWYFISGVSREPVEELAINSAIGFDFEENMEGIKIRTVTVNRYIILENSVDSMTLSAKGNTIMEAREDRQRKTDKRILIGLEKVYIISERYARSGIEDVMNMFFRNTELRDSTYLCICKGKPEDIMKIKIKGYPSAGDFIEGLIEYSREQNFFPENYKLIDAYTRMNSEGRNLVVPYIIAKEDKIQIDGIAFFKGDKMIGTLPMQKTKFNNLLRENNIMGVINLQEDPNRYLCLQGKSKRKVKCYKEKDEYKFLISLKISGELIANDYEPNLINKPEKKKEIEGQIKTKLEDELRSYIKWFKSEYKVDAWELGKVAAAKYGRNTGVDWNEVVSNSDIDVNVSISIDKFGRGDF